MSVLKDPVNIIEFKEIGSTNDKATELANEGAPEWTVVFARKQTRGKGRYHRVWQSPADMGLWFSIILRPQIMGKFHSELWNYRQTNISRI